MRTYVHSPKKPAPRYCGMPTIESPAQQDPTPVLLALGLEPARA